MRQFGCDCPALLCAATGKRGTGQVDVEFLKEIEGWRAALAHTIALRNPALSVYELNFAVQRTIDRIIFLRMAEDRGIEDYGRLLALTNGPAIYARLGDLYRQADEKYDSDLFDFQADTLSQALAIDDKTLKPLLAGLYYPQSPYEFSVLPAEVLGQVYEQFLGKVIRLTAGHRAVFDQLLTDLGIEHDYVEEKAVHCAPGWEAATLKYMADKLVAEK